MVRQDIEWVGVDWGTSNLRAFAIGSDGGILDERGNDMGMAMLKPGEFELALISLIEDWLVAGRTMPVFACGMVGARQGWMEAKYRRIPCQPLSTGQFVKPKVADARIDVHILPGLCQHNPSDVMRGEETQLVGLLRMDAGYTGAVCLPGTHSKWVRLDDGHVDRFTTFMTGELFAMISRHTVLRHSISSSPLKTNVFLEAALGAVEQPSLAASSLFSIRANGLVGKENEPDPGSRLSGLLIGQEIGLSRNYWSEGKVTIIGSDSTAPLYSEVLLSLGIPVTCVDPRSATITGLALAAEMALGKVA